MAADPQKVDSNDETEGMEEDTGDDSNIAQVFRRPDILAALQGRLNQEMIANLPAPVKRRIKALKNLQLQTAKIEAKFYEEVHQLECKYHNLYTPFYEKRGEIVCGLYEPKDDECEWTSDDEEKVSEITKDIKDKVAIEDKKENLENVSGIPDFWLTIFKNTQMLSEMIQEADEPILKHLIDVKVIFLNEPMGFVLEFHFSPNEYFSNSVLTKEYYMKCAIDDDEPFSFEAPEIYKCSGCVIDWKKGKNVTVRTVKKKQKQKSRGAVRTVTKTVQVDSFFNFFNPPRIPEDASDVDEDTQALLTSDYEIGYYIRERIVPKAVLYYTGEALEDEEYEEEEEEEDEDEEEEEEDDDDDDEGDEPAPGKKPAIKGKNAQNPDNC
ncbi:nucleosome assembly protein 1-like 1 isoform X2 [Bemisia tabaci]|nr:PREDICTED: nucleosome assembly protein 1-like 1-B isoform X2 [Bemisia tabaci]